MDRALEQPEASGLSPAPTLARAQLAALKEQIPLLYAVLTVNAADLSATHFNSSPRLLTLVLPAMLGLFCAARTITWLQLDPAALNEAEAAFRIRTTTALTIVIGVAFAAWGVCLYPYGTPSQQWHAGYYMSLTGICCVVCLMHVFRAAATVAAIIIFPVVALLLRSGEGLMLAVAINFVLVVGAVVFIAFRNYRNFESLVVSRHELLARQAELQRLGAENLRLASMDPLTGLPNRRRFTAELETVRNRLAAGLRRYALAIVDLDGFKSVNDLHGHLAGDRLLVDFGDRLRKAAGPSAMVARIGGDEFACLLADAQSEREIEAFAGRLATLQRTPSYHQAVGLEPSASIGLVTHRCGKTSPEDVLIRADYALYRAKLGRRGGMVVFTPEHEQTLRQSLRIEQELRCADFDAELELVYQPIVDAPSGTIVAFEALARWRSPTLGLVETELFISIAERIQLIGHITKALLSKALDAARDWPEEYRLHFNLSALDLTSPATMDAVRALVAGSGVAPSRIEFEITETAMMRDFDQAAIVLGGLKRLGIGVALDDFGTGFSSFRQLHHLRPTTLKIDRSFTRELATNALTREIVASIVDLCRNLRLTCIAEGVETSEQRTTLIALGCPLMQGFLFEAPISGAEIRAGGRGKSRTMAGAAETAG